MTPQEKAALVDDLAFLRKYHFLYLRNWRDNPPLEEVRRGSVILCRLLVDRDLVRAWQAAGFSGEPLIAAIDLAAVVAARGGGVPEFALAGAAAYNRPGSDAADAVGGSKAAAAPGLAFRHYSLSQYLESPSVFLRGTVISRRDIVRYMAHLAAEPRDDAAKIRKQDRDMAERMGRLDGRANAYRQDAFLLELISIGQTLTQTPDVEKLVQTLRGPVEEPAPNPQAPH